MDARAVVLIKRISKSTLHNVPGHWGPTNNTTAKALSFYYQRLVPFWILTRTSSINALWPSDFCSISGQTTLVLAPPFWTYILNSNMLESMSTMTSWTSCNLPHPQVTQDVYHGYQMTLLGDLSHCYFLRYTYLLVHSTLLTWLFGRGHNHGCDC